MCHKSSGFWGRRVTVPEPSLAETCFLISFIVSMMMMMMLLFQYKIFRLLLH